MDGSQILQMLESGDRRSVRRAAEVAELVKADPARVGALIAGMEGDDPVVRMRAADALEKATRERPELLAGYEERLEAYLNHKSRIVRVHALEALTALAERDERWLPQAWKRVNEGLDADSPAVRARCRKLVRRLSRLLEREEGEDGT